MFFEHAYNLFSIFLEHTDNLFFNFFEYHMDILFFKYLKYSLELKSVEICYFYCHKSMANLNCYNLEGGKAFVP